MSRNLKREYLKKLHAIETRNGYKIDLANYIYNPSHDCEYPALTKIIEETPDSITKNRVFYFKYYDGTGMYQVETYTAPKESGTWVICREKNTKDIEPSNRFNLNKLIQLAETF